MKTTEKIKSFFKRLFKGEMKMREKRNLFEIVINAIFGVILVIAYIIGGLIIAVPYIYLAGWDADKIVSAVLFAPLIAAVLCLFFLLGRAERYSRFKVFNTTFWIGIVYFLLPVIANGVSIFLKWAELPYGDIIFEYRYQTFLILPIIIIMVLIYGILESVWNWLFSKKPENQELRL